MSNTPDPPLGAVDYTADAAGCIIEVGRIQSAGFAPAPLIKRMSTGTSQLRRAGIGYKELAERLNRHGLEETETSITGKLARGTFAASFLLACLAVLELEGMQLEDL